MSDNGYSNEFQNSEPQAAEFQTEVFQTPDVSVNELTESVASAPVIAADTSAQRAMLTEALGVVDTLKTDRDQLKQYNDTKRKLEKNLDTLTRNIEREKADTTKSRRQEIESGFDKQIKAVESEIGAATNRRQKARDEAVKERIAKNTAGLRDEIESIKTQMKDYIREQNAPTAFGSRAYYTLFSPLTKLDWLIDILIAAVLVGAIIYAYVRQVSLPVFLTVLGVIVLLGVIYVVISTKTKGTYHEAFITCKNFFKGIGEREKTIQEITKSIHDDKDDSVYNLGEYDAEIQQKNQQKSEIDAQKAEALSQFDNVTKGTILSEIDAKYAEDLSVLKTDISQNADAVDTFSQKVAAGENRLNNEFAKELGKKNLAHDRIEQLIGLLDSGEATSVSDAVSRLK